MRPDAAPDTPPVAARHQAPPSLARNASWQGAATIARVAVGLLTVPIYTRLLGMPQWGLLALFQAAIAPLALLDSLGNATVKHVAESLGRGDCDGATRIAQTTLVFNLAVGAVGALALVGAAPWLATSVFAIPYDDIGLAVAGFRVIGGIWLLHVVAATYFAVIVAHQQFGTSARLSMLSVALSAAFGVAAAGSGGNVVHVLLAQSVAAGISVAVHFKSASQLLPGLARLPRWDRKAFRRSFGIAKWQVVLTAGVLLTAWSDRYVLGVFFVPAVVGVYAVANLLSAQLLAAFADIGDVLFPAVSHLEGRGDLPAARRLSLVTGWTLATALGICTSVLAVVGGDFVQLWIAPEVGTQAQDTLRLLCVAAICSVVAIAPFTYLLGLGKLRWEALSTGGGGVVVVVVGVTLVPRLGLTGIGYGLIAAALVRWAVVALTWREYYRRDVRAGSFAAHVFSPALIAIATLAALAALHDRVAHEVTWSWLVTETLLTAIAAAAIQLGVSELLPGGAERRRAVVASFKPLLVERLRGTRGAGES